MITKPKEVVSIYNQVLFKKTTPKQIEVALAFDRNFKVNKGIDFYLIT